MPDGSSCLPHATFQRFASSEECCFVNFCVGLGVPLAGQRGGSARWVPTTRGARGPQPAQCGPQRQKPQAPGKVASPLPPGGLTLVSAAVGPASKLTAIPRLPHRERGGPSPGSTPALLGPDTPPANATQALGWSACLPARPGSVDMLAHR